LGVWDFNKKVQELEYAKYLRVNELKRAIDGLNEILPEASKEQQGVIEDKIIGLKELVVRMGDGKQEGVD
jgi:hypothetical protein